MYLTRPSISRCHSPVLRVLVGYVDNQFLHSSPARITHKKKRKREGRGGRGKGNQTWDGVVLNAAPSSQYQTPVMLCDRQNDVAAQSPQCRVSPGWAGVCPSPCHHYLPGLPYPARRIKRPAGLPAQPQINTMATRVRSSAILHRGLHKYCPYPVQLYRSINFQNSHTFTCFRFIIPVVKSHGGLLPVLRISNCKIREDAS